MLERLKPTPEESRLGKPARGVCARVGVRARVGARGLVAAAGLVVGMGWGCAREEAVADARAVEMERAGLRAEVPRIDAVLGQIVVMPARAALAPSAVVRRTAEGERFEIARSVRLDDGREVRVLAMRFVPAVYVPGDEASAAAWRWMRGPAGLVDGVRAGEGGREGDGVGGVGASSVWRSAIVDLSQPLSNDVFLQVLLPADALGQGVWFGTHRVALNWVDPARGPLRGGVSPEVGGGGRLNETGRACVRWLASHPLLRWQARLIEPGVEVEPFSDPAVEGVASQFEALWAAGLARLRGVDAALCEELVGVLAAVVELPAPGESGMSRGGGVPVLHADDASLAELRATLLDPELTVGPRGSMLATRVREWIDRRSTAAAWVIDQAGELDAATLRPIARVGAANLRGKSALAWVERGGDGMDRLGGSAAEPVLLAPFRSASMALTSEERGGGEGAAGAVRVRVGAWSGELLVPRRRVAVRPPGATLGAWLADWTIAAWGGAGGQGSLGAGMMANTSIAAVLQREDGAGRGAAAGDESWMVYVEMSLTPTERARGTEVEFWLGPIGRTTHRLVLRVPGEDEGVGVIASVGRRVGGETRPDARSSVVDRGGRVIAKLAVPREAIEVGKDGARTLRLGATMRQGPLRAAWPIAMMPWQGEPARAAFDLKAWDGLGG